MSADSTPPKQIKLRRQSRVLELGYAGGEIFSLPWEFLRVYSPSAEVRGHHPSQSVLQTGKKHVNIEAVKPIGHYAVQLIFDDGHDTGLYTWPYLRELGEQQQALWERYLLQLREAGASRDPDTQVLHFQP
ncbi:MAG: DUF971 domain-containing protein [Congregibacter sp.]